MKKKHLLMILLITFFSIGVITPSAWAGGKHRYRWEGIAIGIGAAMIGHALIQHHRHYHPPPVVVYKPSPPPRYSGHWEVRKIWIPPTYERVWNPGHYNRRGRWIPGQWIKIERNPGYWVDKRVWVEERPYRHSHRNAYIY